ncbi:MAG: hypothetical protein METHP_00194 [Methanoregula sp. SKADARSKE-2]|nr:MAG: hypothetical protein METHP_00194 [Methanoregula sp. SKADARSKE-2]
MHNLPACRGEELAERRMDMHGTDQLPEGWIFGIQDGDDLLNQDRCIRADDVSAEEAPGSFVNDNPGKTVLCLKGAAFCGLLVSSKPDQRIFLSPNFRMASASPRPTAAISGYMKTAWGTAW